MASESSSVHNQGSQNPARLTVIEHAVRCLTAERSTSCCVQREYVKDCWNYVRETFQNEQKHRMENEVHEWERFHDSQLQTRKASDLRVCYLGSSVSDLVNDLHLLIENGVLCWNVWVVVKGSESLTKVRKTLSESKLKNVKLREGDFLSFLKDFEGQFDIIFFDPCASLAEENTLKVIGYVFYYNRLTSPGALITTFLFPPLQQRVEHIHHEENIPKKPAYENETEEKRRRKKEQEGEAAKLLLEQYLKYRAPQFDARFLSETIDDEEKYGDYITYQVIDSAFLFVPVERMLLSTKPRVWAEIFDNTGDILEEILLPKLEDIAKGTGKSTVEQTQAGEFHLQHIYSVSKSAEASSSPGKTWIDEIFPNRRNSCLQKYDISLLLLTPLLFSSHEFILKYSKSQFKSTCLDPISQCFPDSSKSGSLRNKVRWPCTGCLVANLLYGQLANPSFPVINKLLRVRYTSKYNKIFSDVFIFDKCEYVYDQFPTIEGACHSISEPMLQMVYRMALDGLRKHLASVSSSLFQFCVPVWSGDLCSPDDLLHLPKRQVREVECLHSNEAAAHLDSVQEEESQPTKEAVIKEPHMSSFGGQPEIDDTSLEDLELSDCTGTKGLVPPAVRSRGSKSIAAYMRALKNGKTMVVPVRVILIGATGAGKSSLLNALRRKFSMDVPLGKDELMAWSETVWEVTESPIKPWVPFLVRNVSSPGDLPFHVKEWWPFRRPLLEWPAHLLKEMSATIDSEEHPLPCGLCHAFHSVTEKVLCELIFSSLALDHELPPNFMPGEAIYVLVSDLSNAASMESNLDHLVRWMNSIYSSKDTCTENVSSSAHPQVILVGTHADKVVGDPLKPLNVILDRFRGEGFLPHIVDEMFIVDNTFVGQTQEDVNISRLRQQIISLASTLPLKKQVIPLQWLKVEKVLHCLAIDGFKCLTLQQFKRLVKGICHFELEEDSHELLHFLCARDTVQYFNTQFESDSLVSLDPQWSIYLLSILSGKEGAVNTTSQQE